MVQESREPIKDWTQKKLALAKEIKSAERELAALRARYHALGPKQPPAEVTRKWSEGERSAFDQRQKLVAEIHVRVKTGETPRQAARAVVAALDGLDWRGVSEKTAYVIYLKWIKSGLNWQVLHRRHLGEWARGRRPK